MVQHLVRMLAGFLSLVVFRVCPTGARPNSRWRDYISYLAWEHPWIPQEELENITREKDVSKTLLSLLPPQSIEDGQMEVTLTFLDNMPCWLSSCDVLNAVCEV